MDEPFSTTAWVIGLGTLGSALAALLVRNGIRVIGIETGTATLWDGRARVRRHVLDAVDGPAEAASILTWFNYTTRMDWAPPAALVFEAVPENLGAKVDVLRQAHELCAPDTVFVTTTTGLPVAEIAARSGRMTHTVGLHLPDPSRAVVAEVVRTPVTSEPVVRKVAQLAELLGLETVAVADRPGFIGGALLMGYLNRAATMYEQGIATRDDIDDAMTLGCGLPVGPLRQLDLMGLDVAHDALTALHERSADPDCEPATVLARMVSAGLLGRKSGRGFYHYETGEDGLPVLPADDGYRPGPKECRDARPVFGIGVVGAGTMAVGVAEVCARSGFDTVLVARSEVRAKEARAAVERSLDRAVLRKKVTAEEAAAVMDRLVTTSRFDELQDCDLVIEAVAEDLAVKREVFTRLDKVARPGAILASTTSSLSILDCALATSRPQDVVGLHFFNPAPVMKLVEVARTFLTADDVVATAHALGAMFGKRTVSCEDRTGFIVNFLLFPYLNRAVGMLGDRHVSIRDVDRVMAGGCGYPLGPFELLDLIGLDVALAIQSRLRDTAGNPALSPARQLADLAAAGYLGRKTGRGFHRHEPAAENR